MSNRRKRGFFSSLIVALWNAVDWSRRLAVNLLFLVVVVLLVGLLLAGGAATVEEGVALRLAPSGELVEQLWGEPSERLLLDLLGQPRPAETLMRDVLGAIERATGDDRVQVLVLDVDRLEGAGLTKLERLRQALEAFQAAGKRVVAVGDFYFQGQYHLAAAADEVAIHPMGGVLLTGYGVSRRYYRELLDKLEVDWNVFRVGEYKSAVEPYLRNDMSPEAREAQLEWLGDLWGNYRESVAQARGLPPEALDEYVDQFHRKLAEHDGDMARLALAEGLVDRIATRDELREWLAEEVGQEDSDGDYRRIGMGAYLEAVGRPERSGDRVVAVVVAKGTILDGEQPPGTVGGETAARLLRQAREDESVAAVVLRVDSPGGSAFASELIRREVEVTRAAGKPVVASMGSVAASGGYWISMTADEIWASPSTITGSIGIYAMVPTFQRSLAKVGVYADAAGTSPWAGRLRPEMDLPEQAREALRLMIERGYRDFITKAAAGRGMTVEEVDRVARGRVWSGEDAHALGLVDRLGGLEEAIAAAAERAELGDEYGVRYFEKQPSSRARWLEWLLSDAAATVRRVGLSRGWSAGSGGAAGLLGADSAILEQLREPFSLWAYCFCDESAEGGDAAGELLSAAAAAALR